MPERPCAIHWHLLAADIGFESQTTLYNIVLVAMVHLESRMAHNQAQKHGILVLELVSRRSCARAQGGKFSPLIQSLRRFPALEVSFERIPCADP